MKGPDRPVVGVSMDVLHVSPGRTKYTLLSRYHAALRAAGALVVALPPDPGAVADQLGLVDAVVLPGGDDLDPALWAEEPAPDHEPSDPERTGHDLALVRACVGTSVPLLGICLGAQALNVARGGSLRQRLAEPRRHHDPDRRLELRHDVAVRPGTALARALALDGAGRIDVNSSHRRAPGRIGDGLIVAAESDDGVVEAVELPGHPFCVGVQWHPEAGAEQDAWSRRLFAAFVEAARDAASRR